MANDANNNKQGQISRRTDAWRSSLQRGQIIRGCWDFMRKIPHIQNEDNHYCNSFLCFVSKGTFTGRSGTISSPNFPNVYPQGTECWYRIIVPNGYRVKLSFRYFKLGDKAGMYVSRYIRRQVDRLVCTAVGRRVRQVVQMTKDFHNFQCYCKIHKSTEIFLCLGNLLIIVQFVKCVLNGLSRKSRNPFTAERSKGQNSANSPYLFFLHCMPWNVLQSLFLAARYCIKKYGRTPLNTDTSFGQFSLSLGKALSFVSCPINRFSQKINLINADTSLSVLFCNRSFLNSFMNLEKSFS